MWFDQSAVRSLHAFTLSTCIGAAALAASAVVARAQDSVDKARSYIEASEKQWVEAVVTGKTEDLDRILADDLVGVDSEGRFYDKATFLAEIREAPKYFSSNVLNQVKVRFFGDTAVAQGYETFEKRGDPKPGRFVFTDTWVLRNGKWQVVATSAVVPPPEAAK